MKLGDCYPGDKVRINDVKFSIGHMVLHFPNRVQVFDLENKLPETKGVYTLSLDRDVQQLIARGLAASDNLNHWGYLESVIQSGMWKPLSSITEQQLKDELLGTPVKYELTPEEQEMLDVILKAFKEAGIK